MKEIISIKFNPRVEDVTHLGTKTGNIFKNDIAKVSEWGNPRVTKIEEITPTIYDIHIYQGGCQNIIKRIFNPSEVIFELK